MTARKLGRSGLEITGPLAFGGNVFGWTIDEPKSFKMLDALVAAGLNFIDTADVYSKWVPGNRGGESEIIIGKWLKQSGKRDKVIVATKVGMQLGPELKGLSRSYILRAVEDSLRRLQIDHIDLYQSHEDDKNTPLEETLGAYGELIKQGKIRAIGASNYTADRLSESLAVSRENGLPRYESLQPLYNLYDRSSFEERLETLCVKENIGVITYFSLASGFLSGKYRSESDLSQSQRGQGVKKYLNDRGMRILQALDDVAARYQSTPAKVSLAWLISRPGITAPIVSATTPEQFSDLIDATRLVLDDEATNLLEKAGN